jgi:IMP dehydrogenase/GMP reductase
MNLSYGYQDFALKPIYKSIIEHRADVDTSTKFLGINLSIPLLSAPMKTVTNAKLAIALRQEGGLSFLPRSSNLEVDLEAYTQSPSETVVSIPATGDYMHRIKDFIDLGATRFCIDTANGYHSLVEKAIKEIRTYAYHINTPIYIIAGNVASWEGYKFLAKLGVDAVRCGISSGCFAEDTRILMSNGTYQNIQDLQIGDTIIDGKGKPTKVKNIQCTGIKSVIALNHTQFYKDTLVTPDHNFYIANLDSCSKSTIRSHGYLTTFRQSKEKTEWRRIDQLNNSTLLIPQAIQFNLPKTFKVILRKRDKGNVTTGFTYKEDAILEPNYNLGYIFGTFLGDGHAATSVYKGNHRGSVHWYFGVNEDHIAKKLQNALFSLFPNKNVFIKKTKNLTIVDFYYKPFADFLVQFGKRKNKHFLPEYIVHQKDYLLGIYDGLIDSDGNNLSQTFINTSSQLIELFNIITYLLFGSFPNSRVNKKTTGNLQNCNIENCSTPFTSRLNTSYKKRLTGLYQLVKVLNIKPQYINLPVYDIEVESEEHSFIANNTIVHNSACDTFKKTAVGVGMASLIREIATNRDNHLFFTGQQLRWPKIIADGGIRQPSDFCLALALGADIIMAGNLFAGTLESPGAVLKHNDQLWKHFSGEAAQYIKGKDSYVEGADTLVKYKGSLEKVVKEYKEGLQSSMSYMNCKTIEEFKFLEDEAFVILSEGAKGEKPITAK